LSTTLSSEELDALRLVVDDYYGPIDWPDYKAREQTWHVLDNVLLRANRHPDYTPTGTSRHAGFPDLEVVAGKGESSE
jgi:hypothetical protein